MIEKIRAYPMIVLLLPLVAAILLCERTGVLYPEEKAVYDSLLVHTFVLTSENRSTAKCERFEASTYGGRVYVYVLRDSLKSALHAGDTVVAQTRIRRVDSIGDFDYHQYLLRQGIIGSAFVSRFQVKPCTNYREPLQKRLYRRLQNAGLEGDELATIGALTLGYKEDLDPELRHRFQSSGAAHVLAVSGLHTGIIYLLVMSLLTLGGRIKPKYENQTGRCTLSIIIIAVMWFYAWLTGLTPSVVRAVIMVSIVEAGRMFYRQGLTLNSIAAAAFLILLIRPLDLWSVSFQLSFTATIAIVLIAKWCEKRIPRMEMREFPGRFFAWVLGIIIVSIAAQIGTLPLTMYYFGYASTYFLLTNLIVLPIATFLVPCGLVSIALGGSMAGIWFSKITWAFAWLMNHSVGWIESLPGSTIAANVGTGMVVMYYVLVLMLCLIIYDK